MRLVTGNFLDQKADVYVFSSNGVVIDHERAYPRLVMGRGAARAMLTKFPGIDVEIGQRIVGNPRLNYPGIGSLLYKTYGSREAVYGYGGLGFYLRHGVSIGALQVKEHWRDPAKMERLSEGVEFWQQWAKSAERRGQQISMNFPGIGAGGLDERVVMPVISVLPDNVAVCRL